MILTMMERTTFAAELQHLPKMLLWIRERLAQKSFDAKWLNRLELASEEALMNVIQHAYGNRQGKVEIELTIAPEHVEIAIRDWGPPYDPLAKSSQVDLETALEKRKTGGLGIYLIQQIMDEVVYRREKTANLLTLVKHFSRKK